LIALQSAFAQIPTNGLVGYWPFNGNANDESGNGNNLPNVGSAPFVTDRFGNVRKGNCEKSIGSLKIVQYPTDYPMIFLYSGKFSKLKFDELTLLLTKTSCKSAALSVILSLRTQDFFSDVP
jgi:hypothetical protein